MAQPSVPRTVAFEAPRSETVQGLPGLHRVEPWREREADDMGLEELSPWGLISRRKE